MKLLLKILFFILAIFQTNISEAKIIVFDATVSEINFTVYEIESKNEASVFYENDFGISCKSEIDLVDHRNLVKGCEANAAKGGMTELQLVTRAAQKAETAIGGSGGVAGTLKHTYAKNLLSRYQSMYGGNLSLGSNYFNGPAGRGFLDAVNHSTKTIYDFKFGNAFMSNSQFLKYSNSFPGYGIQIIKP